MATDPTLHPNFPLTVEGWLRDNPGQHRPTDVAQALGVDTARAANTLAYLTRASRVTRHRDPDRPNGPGASTYSKP